MKPITPAKMMKLLQAHGWGVARITGSHYIFSHPEKAIVIPVPNHSRDLRQGTQISIMRVAGISRDEL